MEYVVGIDPGVAGGLVVIDFGKVVYRKTPFDGFSEIELVYELRNVANKFPGATFIKEDFISSYSNGNTSFKMGRQHGIIDITLRELNARVLTVRAKEWQRELHNQEMKNLKSKFLSLLAVEKLFVGEEWRVPLKKKGLSRNPHDGLMDAALIALFGVNLLAAELTAKTKALRS